MERTQQNLQTVLPNFPKKNYLSKKKPVETPSLGSSDAREISAQRLDSKFLECNPADISLSWSNAT